MKRTFTNLIIVCMMILVLFCLTGCDNNQEENTIEKQENKIVEEKVEDKAEEKVNVESILIKVLNSEEKFITENANKIFLKDFNEYNYDNENMREIEKYCFVNLDQEGENELVALTKSNSGYYLILHYDNDEVYGYFITDRGIINIKADGTSASTGGAYTYGYNLYKFNKEKYETIQLAHKDYENYIVDNQSATKEQFEEFEKNQNLKQDIEWIEIETKLHINN